MKESRKLGDELFVVVARDSTAARNGKSPIFSEETRLKLVSELKPVDRAMLGHEGDIFQTVLDVRPDIITLGFDQRFDADKIVKKCSELGMRVRVERISKSESGNMHSSSQVRQKLLEEIENRI
ncbi:MAG: FAD synthase [Thermoplasmataceae archaeon]